MTETSLIMDYVDPGSTSTVYHCDIATPVTLLTQMKMHETFGYLLVNMLQHQLSEMFNVSVRNEDLGQRALSFLTLYTQPDVNTCHVALLLNVHVPGPVMPSITCGARHWCIAEYMDEGQSIQQQRQGDGRDRVS